MKEGKVKGMESLNYKTEAVEAWGRWWKENKPLLEQPNGGDAPTGFYAGWNAKDKANDCRSEISDAAEIRWVLKGVPHCRPTDDDLLRELQNRGVSSHSFKCQDCGGIGWTVDTRDGVTPEQVPCEHCYGTGNAKEPVSVSLEKCARKLNAHFSLGSGIHKNGVFMPDDPEERWEDFGGDYTEWAKIILNAAGVKYVD
jgi:hypothetical protein